MGECSIGSGGGSIYGTYEDLAGAFSPIYTGLVDFSMVRIPI